MKNLSTEWASVAKLALWLAAGCFLVWCMGHEVRDDLVNLLVFLAFLAIMWFA